MKRINIKNTFKGTKVNESIKDYIKNFNELLKREDTTQGDFQRLFTRVNLSDQFLMIFAISMNCGYDLQNLEIWMVKTELRDKLGVYISEDELMCYFRSMEESKFPVNCYFHFGLDYVVINQK